MHPPYKIKRHLAATQIIVIGFLLVIIIGGLLLTLPISSANREFTNLEDAMFTAVSSTCVTGLVTVDTVMHWSTFGQVIILCMIQIGGLGFMTIAVLLSMLLKRTITPRERIIVAQALSLNSFDGTIKLVRRILIGTLVIELSGAILLSTQFIPIFGVGDGIFKSIFHSISAFCNAGFDLMGNYSGEFSSLAGFYNNYVVNGTIMLLIIIGGIGFVIWNDIVDFFREHKRVSVYTKFILLVTAILILIGWSFTCIMEWNNPATIGNFPTHEKLLSSLFHSVTLRTAGFSTLDYSKMYDSTNLIGMLLMFVGGASGSTAGGIKAGTIGLIVLTVLRVAKGHTDVVLFKRKVSQANILRAMALAVISIVLILSAAFLLSFVDNVPFFPAMYEAFSAFGTVGLSLSLTTQLSLVGHIILMLMMFTGRVGILTITYAIMMRMASKKACITYPETPMLIG